MVAGPRYNRRAMIVRRLWAFLMVVSLLVWLGAIAVGATADWAISCGAGGSGLVADINRDHILAVAHAAFRRDRGTRSRRELHARRSRLATLGDSIGVTRKNGSAEQRLGR